MTPAERAARTADVVHRVTNLRQTYQAVGDHYGLTRERIRQICAAAGVRSDRKRRPAALWLAREPLLRRTLLATEGGIAAAGSALGMRNLTHVLTWHLPHLLTLAAELRRDARTRHTARILALKAKGMSARQIAHALGYASHHSVTSWLKRNA